MWQSQNAWWNHEIGEILHVYHAKTVENVYDLRRFFASLSISLNFNTLAWFQVLQLIVGYSGLCLKNQQGAIAVKLITQAQRWASKKNMAQLWPLEKHRWLLCTPWNEMFEDTPDIYRLVKMYCTSGYLFQTSLSCMLHAKFSRHYK